MSIGQEEERNIDEIAAPSPIQNPSEEPFHHHTTLESRVELSTPSKLTNLAQSTQSSISTTDKDVRPYSRRKVSHIGEEEEQYLNEIVAPVPIGDDCSAEFHRNENVESHQSKQNRSGVLTAGCNPELEFSEAVTLLYTISYLIFFSILGVLARLGVQWLTFYPGAPIVIDNLWANVGGTLVMGFLSEDRKMFQQEWGRQNESAEDERSKNERTSQDRANEHKTVKKTIPLFIGLATGFCGSFTSFSTFMRDTFFALSNNLPTPINHPSPSRIVTPSTTSTTGRNGGYSLMAVLAVLLLTIIMSIGALIVGAQLSIAIHRFTPVLPFRFFRKVIDPFFVFIAFASWLGALLLAIWPPDRNEGLSSRRALSQEKWRGEVLFAIVFAPLGCLTRWYISLKFNGLWKSFPAGTFAVNMIGVCIEGMCYDLQHLPLASAGAQIGGGIVGCQVLQGVMDGFCGALTTVSTWAVELTSLKRRHAYFYGSLSVATGISFMVLIMGSVLWTIGWQSPVCST